MRNQLYVGQTSYPGVPIAVPPLISRATFERAQLQISRNRCVLQGRPVAKPSLLRGLVFCGACGRRMHTYRSHGYTRYRCSGRDRLADGPRCTATSRSASAVDRMVREAIEAVLRKPDVLVRKIRESRGVLDARRLEIAGEIEELRGQLRAVRQQRERALTLFVAGDDLVRDRVHELRRVEEQLAGRIAEVDASATAAAAEAQQGDAVLRRAGLIVRGLDRLDAAGWARLMRLLVDRVIVARLGSKSTGFCLPRPPSRSRARPALTVPSIPVNCAAVPETLAESEFFGHARGAFTGAVQERPGALQLADRGTLFLDEIEDLPLALQAKLLRVVQDREVRPLGATAARRVDVRLIAAANRDLWRMVESGAFRSDLYYRLRVFTIHLPPLRQRRDDIPLLIEHFVTRFNRTHGTTFEVPSGGTLRPLLEHPWPGNVRELENVLESLLILAHASGSGLGEMLHKSQAPFAGLLLDERSRILRVLDENRWNRQRAAQALGISRVTLWRRMERHGIRDPLGAPSRETA